jgi:hypothetical protein
VNPETQIVEPSVAWVTSGFSDPGVSTGSGSGRLSRPVTEKGPHAFPRDVAYVLATGDGSGAGVNGAAAKLGVTWAGDAGEELPVP